MVLMNLTSIVVMQIVVFIKLLGTVVMLFHIPVPLGIPFLAVSGLFFGIFLGGWILALAEIAKVFPVFARRLKLTSGLPLVILSIAAGKTLGSLLYYAAGWM